MKNKPFISILIVNYNGKKYLEDCLSSLFSINYPKNKYEVILVDNDSQDNSVDFIKKNFPKVNLIESDENLGFAGGNNLAYSKAKGEYIVLLNNDTKVDINWLKELVDTAQRKKSIGIVSSKLYFDIPFLELEIISDTQVKSNIYPTSNSYVPYGLILDNISCSTEEKDHYVWYKSGFYEPVKGNYASRWTNGHAVLLVPFTDKKSETYKLSLHGHPHTLNSKTNFEIKIGGKTILKDTLNSKEVKQLNFIVKKESIKNQLIYLVQNAGNILFKNGLGRDRGSVILRTATELREFYDYDSDYYNTEKNLVAMCGASCLIKRKTIKSKYLFDPAYFMYYEDVDLSLKVWKQGYDIVYQPKSIVYHKHRATTNSQPTAFFIAHVEKNYLYFLLTHFPKKIFLIQLLMFFIKYIFSNLLVFAFLKMNYYGRLYRHHSMKAEARKFILKELKKHMYRIYLGSIELEKKQKRGFSELYKELY